MSHPHPTDSTRAQALALLERFGRRLLPGVLRRIGAWKGISAKQLADLQDDVLQELRVDCLTNAEDLLSAPARVRHARWMQLSERTIYRLRRHLRHCAPMVEEPRASSHAEATPPILLQQLVALHNGRANVAESARAAGLGRRAMRRQLDLLAAQLGWDQDRRRFWQTRAAEALTDLAADQLRSVGAARERGESPTPDLAARRARLQRLAQRFPVQPATLQVRRALQPWLRRQQPDPPPRELLRRATELAPNRAAGWLWLFELLTSSKEVAAATSVLRRASRCPDVERTSVVLARARLLQLRGMHGRASGALRRALQRRDPDRRLQRALARITA